ncbi:MAG: 50S ribosomal protein L4 [Eggerthellaceae bacterium]
MARLKSKMPAARGQEADLNAAVFSIEPNVHVMHTVVRAYRAAMRQGPRHQDPASRGGGKPWRQKEHKPARQVRFVPSLGRRRHRLRSASPQLCLRVNRKRSSRYAFRSAKLADEQR